MKRQKVKNISLSQLTLELKPRIINTKPENNSLVDVPQIWEEDGENVQTQLYIVVDFSKDMDKESVEKSINVFPSLGYIIEWKGNIRLLLKVNTLGAIDLLKLNTKYKVTLGEKICSIEGYKLGMPYSFEFTTGKLKVIATNPENKTQSHAPADCNLSIIFNAQLLCQVSEKILIFLLNLMVVLDLLLIKTRCYGVQEKDL